MQQQEEQFYLKQSLKEKREKEIELQKELNSRLKEDIKYNIESNKEQKLKKIKEEAQIIREQKKVSFLYLTYIRTMRKR